MRTKRQLLSGFTLIVLHSGAVFASELGAGGSIAVANASMAQTREPSLNSDTRSAVAAPKRQSESELVPVGRTDFPLR